MRITDISTGITPQVKHSKKKIENYSYANLGGIKKDSFSFTGIQADNIIKFRQTAKTMHVVSFTGLNDPTPVAIQFKVRGVIKYQDDYEQTLEKSKIAEKSGNSGTNRLTGEKRPYAKYNSGQASTHGFNDTRAKSINQLADSDWKDGKVLGFGVDPKRGQTTIVDPNFGTIGRVPDELEEKLKAIGPEYNSSTKRAQNFRLELSNLIAGTTKGAKTTGVRVNLVYTGKDAAVKEKVENAFNGILNDETCNDLVFLYQPKADPDEVLAKIFKNNEINGNAKANEEAKRAISNITDVINDPDNKNILLIGHCKPDGDTLGCILGLKNAIDYKYTDKNVDCAVDDKIPGLFRSKLPGVDDVVKRPFGKNKIVKMNQAIAQLDAIGSKSALEKIEILKDEKEALQNPAHLIRRNKKYDVVVLMDVPTPKRFTDEFKEQIEGAKKVIYIDHHPHRFNEWQDAKSETGIDMAQIHKNGLAWVADAVPAATEQVAILAKKLIPNLGETKYKDLSKDKQEKLDAFVASTVVGMSTDTGAFTRTANLLPEHMELPAQQRPNFMPEGLSKWLTGLSDKVDKKWLREEITYDIPDTKVPDLDETARDQMVGFAKSGQKVFENLSLGVIEVDYDKMFTVWKSSMQSDKLTQKNYNNKTEFLDIQNAFKYSDDMGRLKSDPSKRPVDPSDYKGQYDDDRIAILICQDKKEGELDEKYNISTQNGLRLSFRSAGGSDHGELLANLFGGGGHGGASGGRVDLPGIEINSKLAVLINGKKEYNSKVIYDTLRKNVDVRNDDSLSDDEKLDLTAKVDLKIDNSGKTCTDLIESVTKEIRSKQVHKNEGVANNNHHKPTSFRGLSFLNTKVS
jgi:nanoRNase/pAp phosphatase (c-di-AMP/oligoRNAs hydrolase)